MEKILGIIKYKFIRINFIKLRMFVLVFDVVLGFGIVISIIILGF